MADYIWPLSLPTKFISSTYEESFADNLIRSPTDVGPGKQRRRSTGGVRKVSGDEAFTAVELGIFDTFFHSTLSDGAERFEWTHPRLGTTKEFRFIAGIPPKVIRKEDTGSKLIYYVTLTLDILP